MAGINKVILVGNLGKDPEVRHLENNVAVATFSLATSESYKDKNGQRVDKTEWHNIVMWRGLADVAEKYLKKGQMVYIEGKIRNRSYQDKEGQTRYTTEIVADEMTMLGARPDGSQGGNTSNAGTQSTAAQNAAAPVGHTPPAYEEEPDDLPF
ncbi:single-stranded DNA-binding protein [Adhaeribacter sp. BT258]|uniref:Single-stranded DNA-binding protein n=1 Tax=Adhaeribacter terrigena TaxID=2793070 RepID=A0ABS1C6Y2_9BACT|nr:single-stranded DNA-binding protein [Adhaeribacter terrigena]MBK0404448.1 single-stranded DNA-binding protein [Adhaeribacter terrigena]